MSAASDKQPAVGAKTGQIFKLSAKDRTPALVAAIFYINIRKSNVKLLNHEELMCLINF